MDLAKLVFPQGFLWGTATAGHQVEGHNIHSDWWTFEQQGKINDGTVSGPACDAWNRYDDDFAQMRELGYPAYRLGIEWARIEPRPGQWDGEAVAQYRRMLDSLKSNGIAICLTMYHWVLPQWVADAGGWTNDETVVLFERYCRFIVDQFAEYPALWCTLNEPMVPLLSGYVIGYFPPGKKDIGAARRVFVNLLKAQAAAYRAVHSVATPGRTGRSPLAGIAAALSFVQSGSSSPITRWQARLWDSLTNTAFLEAMKTGKVPFPWGRGQAVPGLKGAYDFMGVNYYQRVTIGTRFRHPGTLFAEQRIPEGTETTEMGWEVCPEGFHHVIMDTWRRMSVPIYVLENGISDADDDQRPSYLVRHLAELHRAIQDGADVRGYFHWSFMDNFEWREGFSKKFGLLEVDFSDPALPRRLRPSAGLYSRIIRENGLTGEMLERYAPAPR